MPMHDWTRVDAGIYHDFHHELIAQIKHVLNAKLPHEYYALAEQHAAGFGPDVLALETAEPVPDAGCASVADADGSAGGVATLPATTTTAATSVRPATWLVQESQADFYLGKQKSVVIHHVSGDRVVAIIELVSPGNKGSAHAVRAFVSKAKELLKQRIHLLIVDPFPVNERVPRGLHAEIFDEHHSQPVALPADKPLGLYAYECDTVVRAYIEPVAVGDALPDMPIFLYPGTHVPVPLELTYQAAWEAVPKRWQSVIAATEPRTAP